MEKLKQLTEAIIFPIQLVNFDTDEIQWQKLSTFNPKIRTTSESPSYITHTSGSTGKPKGALNTHKGVHNLIHWIQDSNTLIQTDKLLFQCSIGWDPSILQIFWAWNAGINYHFIVLKK